MIPTVIIRNKKSVSISRRTYASAVAQPSFLARKRMQKNKANFIHPQKTDDSVVWLRYPYERLGDNSIINFELTMYGVAPTGENAFRNLHLRHLVMKTPGKADAARAIHVNGHTPERHKTYFSQSPHAKFHSSQPVATEAGHFKKLMEKISRHIGDSRDVYLTDACIGSGIAAQVNVRAITNDPLTALYLHHMLHKTSVGVQQFRKQIYVLHAPDFVVESPELFGFSQNGAFTSMMLINGETVLDGHDKRALDRISAADKQMLVDTETAILIIGGTNSFSVLQSGLSTVADHVLLRKGLAPLEATTITKGNKATVVFDPESILASNGVNSDLFSHKNSIAKGNVYKYFGAATHSNINASRNFGDIVQKFPGKKNQVTQPLQNKDLSSTPSGILILASDSTNTLPVLSRVTSTDAAVQLYSRGYSGDSSSPYFIKNRLVLQPSEDSLTTAFASFVQASNSKVHIINTSRAGKSLNTLIDSVVSGAAASAPATALPGIKLEAVTRIDGVPANQLEPQGSQKPADYAAATKSLGAKLGISG